MVYAKEKGWETEQFRGNLQIIFTYMNVLTNASLIYNRVITAETFETSLKLFPAMLIGAWIGGSCASQIDKDKFRVIVLMALAGMGAMYLGKSLAVYLPALDLDPHHWHPWDRMNAGMHMVGNVTSDLENFVVRSAYGVENFAENAVQYHT